MANKTIHQLSAMNEFDSGDEFAVYDTSANTTGKMTIANVLGTSITGLGTTATTIPGAISELNTGLGTVNTLLGSGDISSIGDGSVTGAISSLNNDLVTVNNNTFYTAGQIFNQRAYRTMGRVTNNGKGIYCWLTLAKPMVNVTDFTITNFTAFNAYSCKNNGVVTITLANSISAKSISGNLLVFCIDITNSLDPGSVYLLEFSATVTLL